MAGTESEYRSRMNINYSQLYFSVGMDVKIFIDFQGSRKKFCSDI